MARPLLIFTTTAVATIAPVVAGIIFFKQYIANDMPNTAANIIGMSLVTAAATGLAPLIARTDKKVLLSQAVMTLAAIGGLYGLTQIAKTPTPEDRAAIHYSSWENDCEAAGGDSTVIRQPNSAPARSACIVGDKVTYYATPAAN